MSALVFGTGGIPNSSRGQATVDGIRRIAELGLGCMEVEFVQGVKMGEASAGAVREVASEAGVRLTVHGPYYINLNAREPEKVKASQLRILQTARIGAICGAESLAFHAAFYSGMSTGKTYAAVRKNLGDVVDQLAKEKNQIWVRPEITGKASEFGTLEEVLKLCSELERVAPCLDVAHCHARNGQSNSYPEFVSALDEIAGRLGRAALDSMHIHFSGIHYGKKGELKHLNLEESDLNYVELLKALKHHDCKGMVVCESPNLEEDALLLQATYNSL